MRSRRVTWQLAEDNTSTGEVIEGRRLSQALVIVPKERGAQLRMQVTAAEQNELVNRIRDAVAGWRRAKYPGATSATIQLLWHWRSEAKDPRLFFAQVEAAETLIWLTEANASRDPVLAEGPTRLSGGQPRLQQRYQPSRGEDGHRVGQDRGDGHGHRLARRERGRVATPRWALHHLLLGDHSGSHRFVSGWLCCIRRTPRTSMTRCGCCQRANANALGAVKVEVLNFQAFQRRDRLSAASSDAKKLLRSGRKTPELESMSAVLNRTLRGFPTGRGAPKVCVLNDEAHHCYLPGRRSAHIRRR